jgi:hypothetical protein
LTFKWPSGGGGVVNPFLNMLSGSNRKRGCQGDRMSFCKHRPKCCPRPVFLPNLMHHFKCGKKVAQKFRLLPQF